MILQKPLHRHGQKVGRKCSADGVDTGLCRIRALTFLIGFISSSLLPVSRDRGPWRSSRPRSSTSLCSIQLNTLWRLDGIGVSAQCLRGFASRTESTAMTVASPDVLGPRRRRHLPARRPTARFTADSTGRGKRAPPRHRAAGEDGRHGRPVRADPRPGILVLWLHSRPPRQRFPSRLVIESASASTSGHIRALLRRGTSDQR